MRAQPMYSEAAEAGVWFRTSASDCLSTLRMRTHPALIVYKHTTIVIGSLPESLDFPGGRKLPSRLRDSRESARVIDTRARLSPA